MPVEITNESVGQNGSPSPGEYSRISEHCLLQLHGRLPGQIVTIKVPIALRIPDDLPVTYMFLHIVQVIRVLKMLERIFWIHDLMTIDAAVNCELVNSTGCVPMLPGLRPVQLA